MGLKGERAHRDPQSWAIDADTGCWLWNRAATRKGRAQAWNGRYMDHANRLVYADKYGSIPEGYDLHHRCRDERCVNPDHMEPLLRGEHGALHTRLSQADVDEIRRQLSDGKRQVDIAPQFNITQVRVSQIKRGIAVSAWQPTPGVKGVKQ